eukprot:jgi/Mesen1/8738/ME000052S08160
MSCGRQEQQQEEEEERRKKRVERLVGVLRSSEHPNSFVPPNMPQEGQWFYADVSAMARHCGLPPGTLLVEVASESAREAEGKHTYPLPRDASELIKAHVMPDGHLTYAFTWYTLSAATTAIAVMRLRSKPIKSRSSML